MKLGLPGDMVAYMKLNMRSAWGSGKDTPRKTGMRKPGIMYTCVCVQGMVKIHKPPTKKVFDNIPEQNRHGKANSKNEDIGQNKISCFNTNFH